MCPHTPEDYSPAEEVRKLRTKQKEEARGRREQAERRMTRRKKKPLNHMKMRNAR
jgi:hypothetical protein